VPRRTNALQKAVKLLEQQKGDYLSLTESAMLIDKDTGIEREVDILLQGQVNGHEITIAVEVRDRARPADSTWVEQTIAKHKSLATDKLILISSSGFYNPALSKARAYGAVTIDTSCGEQELRTFLERAKYIHGARLNVMVRVGGKVLPITTMLQIGKKLGTVEEQVNILLDQSEVKDILLESELGIHAELHSGFSVDGKVNPPGEILEFIVAIDSQMKIPVNLSTMKYGDITYIYGSFEGPNPGYFVSDMKGRFIGHERNT